MVGDDEPWPTGQHVTHHAPVPPDVTVAGLPACLPAQTVSVLVPDVVAGAVPPLFLPGRWMMTATGGAVGVWTLVALHHTAGLVYALDTRLRRRYYQASVDCCLILLMRA